MIFEKTFPSGVRLAAEKIPAVRSVSFGVWVGSGARHEQPEENGASHFIEHMLFKGTQKYTAADLADKMDMLGGEINAFTTKECTCYYGRVLDERFGEASGLIADMFFDSKFDESDADLERGVIAEELGMYEDTPDDLAHEKLAQGVYAGDCLGRPILGTKETLANLTGATLKQYLAGHYTGGNTVLAVAGNYPDGSLDKLGELFSPLRNVPAPPYGPSAYKPAAITTEKQTEQSHIVLGFPGLSVTDDRRYELQLLHNLLGGSMSSRLFQRIREQLGLCYSIYTFVSSHAETGLFGVYVGTGRDTEQKAMEETGAEIRRLLRDGVTEAELARSREQVKTGMLMSLESTSTHMNHLGKGVLFHNRVRSPEEIAAEYDRVKADGLNALTRELLNLSRISASVVTQKGDAVKHLEWVRG